MCNIFQRRVCIDTPKVLAAILIYYPFNFSISPGDIVPSHWSPQPRSLSGAFTPFLVPLHVASAEYQTVTSRFFESQKGAVSTILRIERVQNPYLHQEYSVRKRKMRAESGGHENEKLLFHGTDHGNIAAINAQGFNRNFIGSHGKCSILSLFKFSFTLKKLAQLKGPSQPLLCLCLHLGTRLTTLLKISTTNT